MPKYLGIDYGLERVGLALSDPDGRMAIPWRILKLSEYGSRKKQLDALAEMGRAYGIEALVIGLPLHSNGTESEMSRQARNAGERIRHRLDVPAYLMPEFLSSFEAARDLGELEQKGHRQRGVLDAQAACRILASFIDQPEHLRMLL